MTWLVWWSNPPASLCVFSVRVQGDDHFAGNNVNWTTITEWWWFSPVAPRGGRKFPVVTVRWYLLFFLLHFHHYFCCCWTSGSGGNKLKKTARSLWYICRGSDSVSFVMQIASDAGQQLTTGNTGEGKWWRSSSPDLKDICGQWTPLLLPCSAERFNLVPLLFSGSER